MSEKQDRERMLERTFAGFLDVPVDLPLSQESAKALLMTVNNDLEDAFKILVKMSFEMDE